MDNVDNHLLRNNESAINEIYASNDPTLYYVLNRNPNMRVSSGVSMGELSKNIYGNYGSRESGFPNRTYNLYPSSGARPQNYGSSVSSPISGSIDYRNLSSGNNSKVIYANNTVNLPWKCVNIGNQQSIPVRFTPDNEIQCISTTNECNAYSPKKCEVELNNLEVNPSFNIIQCPFHSYGDVNHWCSKAKQNYYN
jgi:hypothetical protein